jgi:putative endonuclease
MAWYVYVLECRGGILYTGIAIDVSARYAQHVAGRGARFTRANPPERIIAAFTCADRSQATRAEIAIKRLGAAQKRALCATVAGDRLWEALALDASAATGSP